MFKTRSLTVAALLIALDIIFTRFLAFYTPGNIDRLSLQFIPNALSGLMFGPFFGALVLIAGDILGMFINSAGMAFNPLFTLSAAVKGLLYGFMFYKKQISTGRIFLAFLLVTALVDIGLNTVWLVISYNLAWQAVLLPKLLTRSIYLAVQTVLFALIAKPLSNRLH